MAYALSCWNADMTQAYDAIVIGAGHNGLVCAAYLARAGRRVVVVEARDTIGGTASTETFHPGFRADGAHHEAGLFRSFIIADLDLMAHGLAWRIPDPMIVAPLPDGQHLALWQDPQRTAASIRALSPEDGDRYLDYYDTLRRTTAYLGATLARGAPTMSDFSRPEQIAYAMSIASLSCYEWLTRWFHHPAVLGFLAAPGVTGLQQGPRSGGTAHVLLYHHLGAIPGAPGVAQIQGGLGQLCHTLAVAARTHGAIVRTHAPVRRIMIRQGRAHGVQLADGDVLEAPLICSSVDPHQTFLRLVDPLVLPPTFVRGIRRIKFRGNVARLCLALRDLPTFAALPQGEAAYLSGHIQIAPTLDYLERAYDAAKYGAISPEPYLDIRLPSLNDPSLAPAGRHVMSIWMQYAPYQLRQGDWETAGPGLEAIILRTLRQYAPDLPQKIIASQLSTPADLATRYRLTEGALYHGEMTLDQQFYMRPAPGWANYRTPVPGLWLCGAGAHPGGGVTGEPGRLAAQAILEAESL